MKNTALYDFGFTPAETKTLIRIEMKASSEKNPNFQQVRHPRMTNMSATVDEYDILLCLSVSNAGLEWWVFPAADVAQLIADKVITPQHGGQKTDSGTYWVRLDRANRERLANYQATSDQLRNVIVQRS